MITIESPYAASKDRSVLANRAYLDQCILHAINAGETPVAGHKMYTDSLDDMKIGERETGLSLHRNLIKASSEVWCYIDHGITSGMAWGIQQALAMGLRPIRFFAIEDGGFGEIRSWHITNTSVRSRLPGAYVCACDMRFLEVSTHDFLELGAPTHLGHGFYLTSQPSIIFSREDAERAGNG
jgi:hypothetical protein